MIFNNKMKEMMNHCGINMTLNALPDDSFPVWDKNDRYGRTYYGVDNYCGFDKRRISKDTDLSHLEWDYNEVYISSASDSEIKALILKAAGMILSWERQLKEKYPGVKFYLFASFDDGSKCETEEGDETYKGFNMRFFAERGTGFAKEYFGCFESVDDWDQPCIFSIC
ncbi:MAG: hypothetical protein IJS94_04405 [Clostridia bacterium]|nr:hypothetical protein [Clostridia bacterium]